MRMYKRFLQIKKEYLLTSTYPAEGNTVVWKRVDNKHPLIYEMIANQNISIIERVVLQIVNSVPIELKEISDKGWGRAEHRIKDYDSFEELVADNLDMFL